MIESPARFGVGKRGAALLSHIDEEAMHTRGNDVRNSLVRLERDAVKTSGRVVSMLNRVLQVVFVRAQVDRRSGKLSDATEVSRLSSLSSSVNSFLSKTFCQCLATIWATALGDSTN